MPDEPGVYAFVLGKVVVYVGETLRSLRVRMRQYRRRDPRKRASARINGRIRLALVESRLFFLTSAFEKER